MLFRSIKDKHPFFQNRALHGQMQTDFREAVLAAIAGHVGLHAHVTTRLRARPHDLYCGVRALNAVVEYVANIVAAKKSELRNVFTTIGSEIFAEPGISKTDLLRLFNRVHATLLTLAFTNDATSPAEYLHELTYQFRNHAHPEVQEIGRAHV